MKVDISFDDGQIGDLKAAKILSERGFRGTFYIPSCQVPKTTQLSLKELYTGIAQLGHEIGGHTVSHPMDMKLLSDAELEFELKNNKYLLESLIIKGPCEKFCYPRGRHDERVREWVKKVEYKEARTTRVLQIRNDTGDPYQTPTTIHMFEREEYEGIPWPELARNYFLEALRESENDAGVYFSIWGHANEMERQDDWGKFSEFLQFMKDEANKKGVELSPLLL